MRMFTAWYAVITLSGTRPTIHATYLGSNHSNRSLSVQPHTKRREQLLGINRLGQVLRCASFQALFTIALHRLGRQSNDRKPAERRGLPNSLHRSVSIHLWHHDVHQNDGHIGS